MKMTSKTQTWVTPILLVVAFGLLLFANGIHAVALAAWLGPLFLLRFIRTRRPLAGLVAGYIVNTLAFYFSWRPAFVDAGRMFTVYSLFFALIFYLPYVVDRLLHGRLGGVYSTLVFPLAWVTTEYVLHLVSPLGTFFFLPYSQSTALPLLQIMSIGGMWCVSFLITWFAAVANFVWELGIGERKSLRLAGLYGGLVVIVLLYGGLRLAFYPYPTERVTAAALTTAVDKEVIAEPESPRDVRLVAGRLTEEDKAEMSVLMNQIKDDLFSRTRRVARAGARLVTYTEYNVHAWQETEKDVLDEACALAREEEIYLSFPMAVIMEKLQDRPDPNLIVVNKSVMITPDGDIAYEYTKHNLLIGWEIEHAVRGPRLVRTVDSPYGKLASVICLDMEYPSFMRLAARRGADIVMSGAIDGTPSSGGNPMHSIMASYRCIESGFSLIRGGSYGSNVAVDYLGRMVGRSNHYGSEDRTVIAQLPTHGERTFYALVGDLFAWLTLLGLAALTIVALVKPARNHGS